MVAAFGRWFATPHDSPGLPLGTTRATAAAKARRFPRSVAVQ